MKLFLEFPGFACLFLATLVEELLDAPRRRRVGREPAQGTKFGCLDAPGFDSGLLPDPLICRTREVIEQLALDLLPVALVSGVEEEGPQGHGVAGSIAERFLTLGQGDDAPDGDIPAEERLPILC